MAAEATTYLPKRTPNSPGTHVSSVDACKPQNEGFTEATINQALNESTFVYQGNNFLGKCDGEKGLQLNMALRLLKSVGISSEKPCSFVDYGCGDGWFSRELVSSNCIHPESAGYLFDASSNMSEHARALSKKRKNITVKNTHQDLLFSLSKINRADVLFLNMVDLCQDSPQSLENLFRQASQCLKFGGAMIMTTQNPLACPGSFKYYETKKARPEDQDDPRVITRIDGVDLLLVDYHRPLHETLGHMFSERLKPAVVSTCNDDGEIRTCDLSRLHAPKSHADLKAEELWVPMPKKDHDGYIMARINGNNAIKEVNDPIVPITLDRKAAYMGVAALNS